MNLSTEEMTMGKQVGVQRGHRPTGGTDFVQLAARVPSPVKRAVKCRAIERDETVADFVTQALREHLARTRVPEE